MLALRSPPSGVGAGEHDGDGSSATDEDDGLLGDMWGSLGLGQGRRDGARPSVEPTEDETGIE